MFQFIWHDYNDDVAILAGNFDDQFACRTSRLHKVIGPRVGHSNFCLWQYLICKIEIESQSWTVRVISPPARIITIQCPVHLALTIGSALAVIMASGFKMSVSGKPTTWSWTIFLCRLWNWWLNFNVHIDQLKQEARQLVAPGETLRHSLCVQLVILRKPWPNYSTLCRLDLRTIIAVFNYIFQ